MKYLLTSFALAFSVNALALDIQVTLKKWRALRHEENRQWMIEKEQCRVRHPQFFKAGHPDYDKHFQCTEKVEDARLAFEAKMNQDLCKLHQLCDRSPASED